MIKKYLIVLLATSLLFCSAPVANVAAITTVKPAQPVVPKAATTNIPKTPTTAVPKASGTQTTTPKTTAVIPIAPGAASQKNPVGVKSGSVSSSAGISNEGKSDYISANVEMIKRALAELPLPKEPITGDCDSLDKKEGEIEKIVVDPDGLNVETCFGHNDVRDLIQVVGPGKELTTTTYNSLKRPVEVVDPSGAKTKLSYDNNGRVSGIESERCELKVMGLGGIACHAMPKKNIKYDVLGNVIETQFDGDQPSRMRYVYNKDQQLIAVVGPNGQFGYRYYYTPTGKVSKVDYCNIDIARGDCIGEQIIGGATFEFDKDRVKYVISSDGRGITEYEYDGSSRVTKKVISSDGNKVSEISYLYNDLGLVRYLAVKNANGETIKGVRYVYDERSGGRLIQTVEQIYSTGSIADGIPARQISERTVGIRYLDEGRTIELTTTEGGKGVKEKRIFDKLGRLIRIERDGFKNKTIAYDNSSRPIEIRDENTGTHFRNEYDAVGASRIIDVPSNLSYNIRHDNLGNVIAVQSALGLTTTMEHDNYGRLVSSGRSGGPAMQYIYDNLGRVSVVTDYKGMPLEVYSYYDSNSLYYGLVGSVTVGGGRHEILGYDTNGNITMMTDPNGNRFNMIYDGLGRLFVKSATDRFGKTSSTTYGYSALGNVTYIDYVDIKGKTSTLKFEYTSDNRILSEVLIAGGKVYTTRVEYNGPLGAVSKIIHPSGFEVTRNYADNGNLAETFGNVQGDEAARVRGSPVPSNSWALKAAKQSTPGKGKVNDVSKKSDTAVIGAKYIYPIEAPSLIRRIEYRNNTKTSFQYYGTTSRLFRVTHHLGLDAREGIPREAFLQESYKWDADGKMIASELDYGRNANNRLKKETSGYIYDEAGNLLSKFGGIDFGSIDNNTRDINLMRSTYLSQPDAVKAAALHWGYDENDNRVFASDDAANYTLNDNGTIASIAGTNSNTSFTYDANGNMTGRQGIKRYDYMWDPNGRMIAASEADGVLVYYDYDGLGRRIGKRYYDNQGILQKTIIDIWLGDNLIEARVRTPEWSMKRPGPQGKGNSVEAFSKTAGKVNEITTDFMYGNGVDDIIAWYRSDGQVRYAHRIYNNTVAAETDQLGAVTRYNVTDPFRLVSSLGYDGQELVISDLDNWFAYAGRELDPETDFGYMRSRYYYPVIGRFISKDPIGIMGGINLFAYADNNPVTQNDYYGLKAGSGCVGLGCGTTISADRSGGNRVTDALDVFGWRFGQNVAGALEKSVSDFSNFDPLAIPKIFGHSAVAGWQNLGATKDMAIDALRSVMPQRYAVATVDTAIDVGMIMAPGVLAGGRFAGLRGRIGRALADETGAIDLINGVQPSVNIPAQLETVHRYGAFATREEAMRRVEDVLEHGMTTRLSEDLTAEAGRGITYAERIEMPKLKGAGPPVLSFPGEQVGKWAEFTRDIGPTSNVRKMVFSEGPYHVTYGRKWNPLNPPTNAREGVWAGVYGPDYEWEQGVGFLEPASVDWIRIEHETEGLIQLIVNP